MLTETGRTRRQLTNELRIRRYRGSGVQRRETGGPQEAVRKDVGVVSRWYAEPRRRRNSRTLAEIGTERRWDHLAAFVRSDSLRTEKYVQVSMRRSCVSSGDELAGSRRASDMPSVPSSLDSCLVSRRRKSSGVQGRPPVRPSSLGGRPRLTLPVAGYVRVRSLR